MHDHVTSQAQCGHAYANGIGVKKDPARALKFYRQSCKGKDATGQYGMGYLVSG